MANLAAILIFVLVTITSGNAQGLIKIHGIVTDSSGIPLAKATVRVASIKDTLYTLTNNEGTFAINKFPGRKFNLEISIRGYVSLKKDFLLDIKSSSLDLGQIILQVEYTSLENVSVTALRPVVIKEDTIEYRAAAFHVEEGAELGDLLKQLPGIDVDLNDSVSFMGQKIFLLLVNGKSFFGNDIQIALENLPAETIDKVQVIDLYGKQTNLTGVKTAPALRIINIELKKDKRNGKFGNLMAGTGTNERYVGNMLLNSFRDDKQMSAISNLNNNTENGASPVNFNAQSASINYGNSWGKKWSVNGNISFSRQDRSVESSNSQEASLINEKDSTVSDNLSNNKDINIHTTYGFLYKPTSTSTLQIGQSFGIQHGQSAISGSTSIHQEDSSFQKESAGIYVDKSTNNILTIGTNMSLQKFYNKSRRRIIINISFSYSQNQSYGQNTNRIYTLDNNAGDSTFQNYLLSNDNFITDFNTIIAYYEPVGKKFFFECSYMFCQTINNQDHITRSPDSTNLPPKVIDSLSTHFLVRSISEQLHAGYVFNINKFGLNLSVNALPVKLSNIYYGQDQSTYYSYVNYTPKIQLFYNISKFRHFSLSYNESTSQPQPLQLQRVINITNPQYPVVGNPELKPEISHITDIRYDQSSFKLTQYYGFSAGFHFMENQDQIIANILHPHDGSPVIQKTTYMNISGFYSVGADTHINLPSLFHKTLRIAIGSELTSNHSISMVDSVAYNSTNRNYMLNLSLRYSIHNHFEINANSSYSLSTLSYTSGSAPFSQSSSFIIRMECKAAFPGKWTAGYNFSQTFMRSLNQPFKSNPALANVYLQKMLRKKNAISVKLSAYDLLNSSTEANQSITVNSITRSRVNLIGRYFLLSIIMKFNRFSK